MEKTEQNMEIKIPKTVEEAVESFLNGDDNYEAVIAFLKNNQSEIGEFCLQIRGRYNEEDEATPFVMLSMLIKKLLQKL